MAIGVFFRNQTITDTEYSAKMLALHSQTEKRQNECPEMVTQEPKLKAVGTND